MHLIENAIISREVGEEGAVGQLPLHFFQEGGGGDSPLALLNDYLY